MMTVTTLVVLGIVVAATLILLVPRGTNVSPQASDSPSASPTLGAPSPALDFAMQVSPPAVAAGYPKGGIATLVDPAWVDRVAAATGIPSRALEAYAGAEIIKTRKMPTCGVSWVTLAAIGKVESDHGRFGGSSIGANGTVTPPIYGVALDGESTSHIPDSDGGEIDGDAEYDRAVGPMQMIPQTWRNWFADGNLDGRKDPQNIDDAVMGTSNYLCRASGDMVSRDGWRAGILAYNGSGHYAQWVADVANRYGMESMGG